MFKLANIYRKKNLHQSSVPKKEDQEESGEAQSGSVEERAQGQEMDKSIVAAEAWIKLMYQPDECMHITRCNQHPVMASSPLRPNKRLQLCDNMFTVMFKVTI